MAHNEYHPLPVEDCFGCKVMGLGYDAGNTTKVTPVTSEDTGRIVGRTRDHRDGRRDAIAQPETVVLSRRGGKNEQA